MHNWPSLSDAQRFLLLDLGRIARFADLLSVAKEVWADVRGTKIVRVAALRALELIGADQDILEALNTEKARAEDNEQEFLSLILASSLKRRLITVSSCLETATGLDRNYSLQREIAHRLTIESALLIASKWEQFGNKATGITLLWDEALNLIRMTSDLPAEQVDRYVGTVLSAAHAHNWGVRNDFVKTLRGNRELRRAAYIRAMQIAETGDDVGLIWIASSLSQEDGEWLVARAEDSSSTSATQVLHAIQVVLGLNDPSGNELIARLRAVDPELIEDIEWRRAQAELEMARSNAEREGQPNRPIKEVVDEILGFEFSDLQAKLHRLAWICLSEDFRPGNIEGKFEDLPHELQARVLDEVRILLARVQATSIPVGNTIPGAVLLEADAFQRILGTEHADWLTSDLVTRWLPAVLRVRTLNEEGGAISRCIEVFPDETVAVFETEVRRELEGGAPTAFAAWRAPQELWERGLKTRIFELLKNEQYPATSRGALLLALGTHSPDLATEIALHWTRQPEGAARAGASGGRVGAAGALGVARDSALWPPAIHILLAANPAIGLQVLREAVGVVGRDLLFQMSEAFGRLSGLVIAFENWQELSPPSLR